MLIRFGCAVDADPLKVIQVLYGCNDTKYKQNMGDTLFKNVENSVGWCSYALYPSLKSKCGRYERNYLPTGFTPVPLFEKKEEYYYSDQIYICDWYFF